jgi:uncharacterized protein
LIAVDTNLLVYAHREDSPMHSLANRGLVQLAESPSPWAIPYPCLHEFLAIVTHPRIYKPPTPLGLALEQVNCWLESPSLVLLSEQTGYWQILRLLVERSQTVGPRTDDARIAALCLQHQVTELWTADRDFARFANLKIHNPLKSV